MLMLMSESERARFTRACELETSFAAARVGTHSERHRETSLMNWKRVVRSWLDALEDLKAKLDELVSGAAEPRRAPKLIPARVRTR
jgi:hypothetical protein